MRRILCASVCVSLLFGADLRAEPGGVGTNVVLITIDTLRADRVSSYGFHRDTTPRIDELARTGVLFERAVAASSATAPSHASILTSRNVREHSVGHLNGATRLVGAPTLAEQFREAGYRTGAFVSNITLRRAIGLDRGFDVYDDEFTVNELNRPSVSERIAAQTTQRALAWVARSSAPFFLWVHYQDPHGPYAPPPGFAGRFVPRSDPSETPLRVLENQSGAGGLPQYQSLPGLLLPSQYRARYADEIFYADTWVGKLLDALDDRARGAAVLLTADHGESLGEAGRYFAHGTTTLPQEARVPFVVRAPGLSPGRRSDVVGHVDVMPTLLELVGLQVPRPVSGLALGPYLRASEPLPERLVYCDLGSELTAYGPTRLVRVSPAGEPWKPLPMGALRHWQSYAWDGSPAVEVGVDDALRESIRGYLGRAHEMVRSADLTDREIGLLRRLGYVD